MRNKLFIAGFNGCRQLPSTSFYAVFGASQVKAAKFHLNVHSSSQTNTENTTNPRCHPAEILYVAFERSSCFQPRLHPPPSCFLSFRLSAFLPKFSHGGAATWMVAAVASKRPTLCSVKSTRRVVCFILVVLLCRLRRDPRRNGRAPDGKRANDSLFRSLCNSFNI